MADTLTTVTNLINSPPGQLVAGGVLAGIVWTFLDRVGNILHQDTNLEIAVWLLDVDPASAQARGYSLYARFFRAVHGEAFSPRFVSVAVATGLGCSAIIIASIYRSLDFRALSPFKLSVVSSSVV